MEIDIPVPTKTLPHLLKKTNCFNIDRVYGFNSSQLQLEIFRGKKKLQLETQAMKELQEVFRFRFLQEKNDLRVGKSET